MSVAVTVNRWEVLPPELAELVLAEEQAREQEELRRVLEIQEREQQRQQQQQQQQPGPVTAPRKVSAPRRSIG